MAEDVSAQARTGVTIIVLAALIAVVLNLVVIAQNIVSGGLGTLQNAVSSIQSQEYEVYNQKKVTGVEVRTAISLFTARDNGIVVCTKAAQKANIDGIASPAYCYGSLLQKQGAVAAGDGVDVGFNYKNIAGEKGNIMPVTTFGWAAAEDNPNSWSNSGSSDLRNTGDNYYTMEYQKDTAGIIKQYNDIQMINDVNSIQYIQESGTFRAELIKNPSGTVIGIIFFQIS